MTEPLTVFSPTIEIDGIRDWREPSSSSGMNEGKFDYHGLDLSPGQSLNAVYL